MKILHYIGASVLSVAISQTALCQTFSDYAWEGDMPTATAIPEEYQSADAVYFRTTNYNKSSFTGTYPYMEQSSVDLTQIHAKILKEDALEDFKLLAIPKLKGIIADYVQIKYVDVRIRKASGEVLDLKVRDLPTPTLEEDDDYYGSEDDFYLYEITDLEVGDEIERVVLYEAKFAGQGRTVNLYNDYPTLDANFILSVSSTVGVDGRIYNEAPEPDVQKTGSGQTVYTWKAKNLPAVPEASSAGSIINNELQYFVYELNFDNFRPDGGGIEIGNFSDLMWQYADDFLTVRARNKKMVEFYDKIFDNKTASLGKLDKLLILNDYINKEMRIVSEGDLEDNERGQNLEYFVFNNKMTYNTVMILYRDFFERFDIKYSLAFGKSRFSGAVDLSFPSRTQTESYFYLVTIGDMQLAVTAMMGINELPTGLWGTTCYFRSLGDRSASLNKIDFGNDMLVNDGNKRLRRHQVQVKLGDNTIQQKTNVELYGCFATSGRGNMVNAAKNDTLNKAFQQGLANRFEDAEVAVNSAEISTHMTSPNFDFKASYDSEIKGFIAEEEGIYTWTFDNWLSHNVRFVVNPDNRTLDYHVPYTGSDVEELFLIFDKDVEWVNIGDFQKIIDNDYVKYTFQVTPINATTFRIRSSYEIKKLFIPKEDVAQLHEANEMLDVIRDMKVQVKVK